MCARRNACLCTFRLRSRLPFFRFLLLLLRSFLFLLLSLFLPCAAGIFRFRVKRVPHCPQRLAGGHVDGALPPRVGLFVHVYSALGLLCVCVVVCVCVSVSVACVCVYVRVPAIVRLGASNTGRSP